MASRAVNAEVKFRLGPTSTTNNPARLAFGGRADCSFYRGIIQMGVTPTCHSQQCLHWTSVSRPALRNRRSTPPSGPAPPASSTVKPWRRKASLSSDSNSFQLNSWTESMPVVENFDEAVAIDLRW